jgi:hypothetical protein
MEKFGNIFPTSIPNLFFLKNLQITTKLQYVILTIDHYKVIDFQILQIILNHMYIIFTISF